VHQYPEFEESRFSEFTDADLRTFEARMSAACCPDESVDDESLGPSAYDTRRHYQQPPWWTGGAYAHERLRPVESPMYRIAPPRATDDADADADAEARGESGQRRGGTIR
jgi:hypothetical protein